MLIDPKSGGDLSAFFWSAAHGLTLPLLSVYLQSKGLSAGELAVFAFVAQFCSFFSRFSAAVLADHTCRHKLVHAAVSLKFCI